MLLWLGCTLVPTYPYADCGQAKVAPCERWRGSVWGSSSVSGSEGHRNEQGALEKIDDSSGAHVLVAGTRLYQERFGARFEMLQEG